MDWRASSETTCLRLQRVAYKLIDLLPVKERVALIKSRKEKNQMKKDKARSRVNESESGGMEAAWRDLEGLYACVMVVLAVRFCLRTVVNVHGILVLNKKQSNLLKCESAGVRIVLVLRVNRNIVTVSVGKAGKSSSRCRLACFQRYRPSTRCRVETIPRI